MIQTENYLNKYYIQHNQKFLGQKLITLTKTSLQNCAKACYQSENCLSFDFCEQQESNKAFCHLLGHIPSKDEITKSLECAIYIRTKSKLTCKESIKNLALTLLYQQALLQHPKHLTFRLYVIWQCRFYSLQLGLLRQYIRFVI